MIITTKDKNGKVNGWVQTIWRADHSRIRGREYRPDQIYLTVVLPGTSKGPHLHKKRTGLYVCVAGVAEIVVRNNGQYFNYAVSNANVDPVCVLPGNPCEIRCVGNEPAYLLNMPSPAWSADDPDEWPVEDWSPDGVVDV